MMGEDLEIIDVRQRKLGKTRNQHDDIVTSIGVGGGAGNGGHGSNKRKRRGRGGGGGGSGGDGDGDRVQGIKVIPEEEVIPNEPKEKKGKPVIIKKQESDDEEDDGDDEDAYDSSLDDEESSGSWLFKLVIIGIIVSLGFSLIWLNDGSSSTGLDNGDGKSDVVQQAYNDIGESYSSENVENTDYADRGDIDGGGDSYQENSEYQQWNQEEDENYKSDSADIIAEVSETIGESSNNDALMNESPEYQELQDQGYYDNGQMINDQLYQSEESNQWINEQNDQPEVQHEVQPEEEQLTSFQDIPEMVNQQTDYSQQDNWHYEELQQQQLDEPVVEQQQEVPQEYQQMEQAYEPLQHFNEPLYEVPPPPPSYETVREENLAQPPKVYGEILKEQESRMQEQYYECPEGNYWDGLSCVNPESLVQRDGFNGL